MDKKTIWIGIVLLFIIGIGFAESSYRQDCFVREWKKSVAPMDVLKMPDVDEPDFAEKIDDYTRAQDEIYARHPTRDYKDWFPLWVVSLSGFALSTLIVRKLV